MSLRQLFNIRKESANPDKVYTDRIQELENRIAELENEVKGASEQKDDIQRQLENLKTDDNENQRRLTSLTLEARRTMDSVYGTMETLRESVGQSEQKYLDALEENADCILSAIYQTMNTLGIDYSENEVPGRNDERINRKNATRGTDRKKPVLLLVDDNEQMCEFLRGLLINDFDVVEATDGVSGYEIAANIVPDIIISDLVMPGCNGTEYCSRIRSNKSLCHIPFLIITGHDDETTRLNSYKAGVDGYLTKPFKPQLLKARIDSILANRKHMQSQVSTNLDDAYAVVEIEEPDKLFMEKVSQIMRENYSDPRFNVAVLTNKIGMSNTSFYKKITALTGLTTSHYIRLYRLQTAKHIIEEHRNKKGINVSDIAYLVGFNDPKYFTRCFVAQYGIQPKALLEGKDEIRK